MIKILLFIAMLTFSDHQDYDVHQIVGQTCQEATKDYIKWLDENAKALEIVETSMNCKTVEVDPTKTQNGSI